MLVALAGAGLADETEDVAEAASRPHAVHAVAVVDKAITIDGRLDEGPWQRAPTFELASETRPAENGPAPVRTVEPAYHGRRGVSGAAAGVTGGRWSSGC